MGYTLQAAEIFTNSARAFKEADLPKRAMESLEIALSIGTQDPLFGAGWTSSVDTRRFDQERRAVLEKAAAELFALEQLMTTTEQVPARINSTPDQQIVHYRKYVETKSPMLTATTNTTESIDTGMYLFVLTKANGKKFNQVKNCWIACKVEF